jgi:hypothetical protein
MEPYKLHLKIGPHEFSAEGPIDVVKQDYEAWKVLIRSAPAEIEESSRPSGDNGGTAVTAEPIARDQIEKIYLLDEKRDMLSLRMLPRSDDRDADVLLLVILGYKLAKQVDEVMVTQLKPAMRQSGCLVERVDQVAAKYVRRGLLNKGGVGKGGRYSLTNSGLEKATSLLTEMLSS